MYPPARTSASTEPGLSRAHVRGVHPCRVMVGSFIGSQKFTVQQTLERKFMRYLTLPQARHAIARLRALAPCHSPAVLGPSSLTSGVAAMWPVHIALPAEPTHSPRVVRVGLCCSFAASTDPCRPVDPAPQDYHALLLNLLQQALRRVQREQVRPRGGPVR